MDCSVSPTLLGPAPDVSIDDVSVAEGDSGTRDAVFTVSLSAPAGAPFSVRARTADGSAAAGADYEATDVTVAFAAGQSSVEVRVPVIGDDAVEPEEDFASR